MTRGRYFYLILILGLLTTLSPFSIDMYLPGFPQIADYLHTTTAEVDLSLASFFIGISAGQLLYGPLLDRFGRKRPLYIGLILYIIASVGCAFSTSIHMLIVLRFVEAIGSCAAAVASMAMVRDLFPVKDIAKVFALLMLVISASPVLAPTVGGYITDAYSWQWIFIMLAAIALLILIAVFFTLPESFKPDPTHSLKPLPIINSFLTVLKEPQFYTYAFAWSVAFCGLFAYVSGAPLVLMGIYHLSAKTFGVVFALLSVGLIGSAQVNSLLLRWFKSEQLVRVAMFGQAIVGLAFLIEAMSGWFGLYGTIAMIFVFLCCLGIINPNAAALSLAPFSKNAGTASSLMGAVQLGLGALASTAVSFFKSPTVVPMAAIMAVSSVLGLLIILIGSKYIVNKVTATGAEVVIH